MLCVISVRRHTYRQIMIVRATITASRSRPPTATPTTMPTTCSAVPAIGESVVVASLEAPVNQSTLTLLCGHQSITYHNVSVGLHKNKYKIWKHYVLLEISLVAL